MMSSRFVRVLFITAGLLFGAISAQAQQTRTWLMLHLGAEESMFVTDPKEKAHLAKSGWTVSAEAVLLTASKPNTGALQRLVKSSDKGVDRIFSVTAEETASATKEGYVNEGALGYAATTQAASTMIPVYRYTKGSKNMWLIEAADQAWAKKAGWELKGAAFWLWPKPAV